MLFVSGEPRAVIVSKIRVSARAGIEKVVTFIAITHCLFVVAARPTVKGFRTLVRRVSSSSMVRAEPLSR